MPLREVKPFDDKQWSQLQELMKRGPSEQQLKTIAEAKERLKNVHIEF